MDVASMDMPMPCAARHTSMVQKPGTCVVSAVAAEKITMPVSRTILRE